MTDSEFDEAVAPAITVQRISIGNERLSLDWEDIRDLRTLSPEFRQLSEWVALCLAQRRPYHFRHFNQMRQIEKRIRKPQHASR